MEKKKKNNTGAVEHICIGTNKLAFSLPLGNNKFHG